MARRGKGRGRPKGSSRKTDTKQSPKNKKAEDTVSDNGTQGESLATLRLAKKAVLVKEDVICPICWSILIHPTTLPCNHSLCEQCFRKHIEETSLCCPCCRLRLSVWSRKVLKENKLLDEELWARIQNEFPRFVAARMGGLDTQDVLDDELDSLSPNSGPIVENSVLVRDGTICNESGEIRTELEQIIEQHQKDAEAERLREETASANLIKQLLEEEKQREALSRVKEEQDFLFAKQLQDEARAEEARARASANNSSNAGKTPCRNLMREWAGPSSACSNVTPAGKRNAPSNSNGNGQSCKKKHNGKRSTNAKKKPSATVSLDVSRASQDVMNKFLTSSQNLNFPTTLGEDVMNSSFSSSSTVFNGPSTSSSIPNHNINFSAFSPTKAGNKPVLNTLGTPLALRYTGDDYSPKVIKSFANSAITKTPDSINSEIDSHFRPIRGAPKTPPRRKADGTFLPEPKLVRATPIRPSTSASFSNFYASPSKPAASDIVKPSCATVEKRVSNDSGRVSDESNSPIPDEKRSGNTTSSFSTQMDDRGCTSEDYRVTPESDDATGSKESAKKRGMDANAIKSANKKIKVNEDSGVNSSGSGSDETHFKNISLSAVKQEPSSPSMLDDNFYEPDSQSDIASGSVKIESESVKIEPAEIVKIEGSDQEYVDSEARALELFRMKAEQEAADRAFAESLHKSLNREIITPRGRNSREKYSLRSWLNPRVKVEVKQESHPD